MTPSSRQPLLERVARFVQENGLFRRGDRLLLACSGGCDSVAMLDLMQLLARDWSLSLAVAHVDHNQHDRSGQARRFVQERCKRLRLPFFGCVLGPDDLPRGSSEAACRAARYRAFQLLAQSEDFPIVATAHTRSDQVETVLMRILRGTGTAGLAGIPARRGRFVRPMLSCTREMLRAHLRARRLRFLEDPSNQSDRFLRNRLRHELLPLLRERANPGVDQALLRLSRAAARDEDLLSRMTGCLDPAQLPDGGWGLELTRLQNVHPAVLARVILKMVRKLGGPGANLEQRHLERLLARLAQVKPEAGWSMDLSGGLTAGVEKGQFVLRRGKPGIAEGFRLQVAGPGEVLLPGGRRLRFSLEPPGDPKQPGNRRVVFDAGAVDFPLVVRSRQRGDRIRPWGGEGSRKVGRLLIDAKIPRRDRPLVPLLVKDDRVLWVAGLQRSDAAPVGPATRQVLVVELLDAPAP